MTRWQRRTVVEYAMGCTGRSGREACRNTVVDHTIHGYPSGKYDAANCERFQTVAILPPRSIYRRLNQLLHREGLRFNRKRVYRVDRKAGPPPWRRKGVERARAPIVTVMMDAIQRCNMGSGSAELADHWQLRNLVVMDDPTRVCLVIELERVTAALERVTRSRG